jgi:hypothetical protein
MKRPCGGPASTAARLGMEAWPVTLRGVRGWLTSWVMLGRWWRTWSPADPPAQLRLLLDCTHAGRPLHLYAPRTMRRQAPLVRRA